MTRTWLSLRVDLVEGRGKHVWPRPGRIFAASRSHTFASLATAIDDAFGRWDRWLMSCRPTTLRPMDPGSRASLRSVS